MTARKELDAALVELSAETGSPVHLLREAALELAGHADGSDFQTEREEAAAIVRLTTGLRDGSLKASRWTEDRANAEHARLAALHGASVLDRDPAAVKFDQAKLDRHLYAPQPVTPSPEAATQRQPAKLTAVQQAEVDRLSLTYKDIQDGNPQRPAYGAAAGNRPGSYELDLSGRSSPVTDSVILANVLGRSSSDPGILALANSDAPVPRHALSPRAHRELGELRANGLHEEAHRIREHASLARAACGVGDHDGAAHHISRARTAADRAEDEFGAELPNVQAELDTAASTEAAHGGSAQDYGPQAAAHEVSYPDNATDHTQPRQGGVSHPRSIAAIMQDNPDLFGQGPPGDPTRGGRPNATGNSVVRPKSPAERARDRRRSRPGHTGGAG